jgi:hypothetical protein
MELAKVLFIGLGSVVAPIIAIIGFLGLALMAAVVIDELFETFFK